MKIKYVFIVFSIFTSVALGLVSCGKETTSIDPIKPTGSKMKITVGNASFTATLYDNQTANALKALLPLTLRMEDLNANEKFFYFGSTLPTNASRGGTIENGDIMLYGNNCLVLFYKAFNTSYSYSRIGKVDDVTGYTTALGSGDATIKFELQ